MQLEKPTCQTFGHQHVGKCLLGVGACYKCNQPGHLSFDCPQLRGPATRRVYMMKTEEADPYTTLITGRVLVLGVATKALFDSRATHSFISHAFVHRKGIAQVGLTESLLVTIPFGEELSTTSIIQNLKMVLQGHTMHADLIVFPMPEFSIILGMVTMVQDGPSISDMEVVGDYANVFPDDVIGIPPNREVEFSIELLPGTVSISKAPYRLAPTKMKELKEQLQEFLGKGFIHPSVSP
ncbi:uncharacterized protein LOC122011061 [Zingiber officinale]|uniref:uncharacterized protein LOC122011061 n=1 Tax=Zingiber officinale TaxID=94328 RepID=UPI001C4C945E|nr:uncharacterized protein LOC122011061 [Zingiber officinale]